MDVISERNRVVSQIVVALLLVGGCLGFGLNQPSVAQAANTYYVDCGAASNGSGTSQSSPWNNLTVVSNTTFSAGDRILFKAGSTCTGQLWPKGSGTSGNPITVASYGAGNKPLIQGVGAVPDTIYLYNQEYWTISGLEITNYSSTRGNFRAVLVRANNFGTVDGIRIAGNEIHAVNGCVAFATCKPYGGIFVEAGGSTTATKFNDLLIEDNLIYDVGRSGITTSSLWASDSNRTYYFTNVRIRNNTMYNVRGDGIIIRWSTNPLIEYNLVYDSGKNSEGESVGMWPRGTSDALFQYNEVFNQDAINDGQGYDNDFGANNTIFQYNYSHNNRGGFLLTITGSSAIVRYNISRNERMVFGLFNLYDSATIYNNTFYIPATNTAPIINNAGSSSSNIAFYNNIFYNLGTGSWYRTSLPAADRRGTYDYNLIYGNHPADEPADPNKLTTDPLLVSPGSGDNGRNTLNGYKLKSGSPALGSGRLIANNGGKDYWGNAVSSTANPNRGAYGGSGLGSTNADITNLYPVADGYVRDGSYANDNYAAENTLTIKSAPFTGWNRKGYLRFNTAGLSGITNATLRLYLNNTQNGSAVTIKVYGATSDNWAEPALNWNNAPARQSTALSTLSIQAAGYYNFNVTGFLQNLAVGDTTLTLVVEGDANADINASFASREDSAKTPVLIVTN
jgi:hypothetical protein